MNMMVGLELCISEKRRYFMEGVAGIANIQNIWLNGLQMLDQSLDGIMMSHVHFVDATFSRTSFYWCNAEDVTFTNCKLYKCDFRGGYFDDVTFDYCELLEVTFANDNLGSATRIGAVRFTTSRLTNCDFMGAIYCDPLQFPIDFDFDKSGLVIE